MNNKFLKTLEDMRGKTFQYANNIHYIVDIQIDEAKEKCSIKTNLSSFDRPFEAMDEFLKYWQPFSNITTLQTTADHDSQLSTFIQQEDNLSSKLIDILNDNIEKVQKDKEYIPQAQAINNNINSIVNIAKMRFDFMKQFKSAFHRNGKGL